MKPIRLLLLFVFFCPLAMYAQTAEVGGAVQDPSGAVIPKASVEFRNQDTGVRRQTTTNSNGAYHIVGVDPGKYDATIQAKGFKTLTRENVVFQVGDKAQIDFKMQVGDAGQTVTVDGSGLQINTIDGSVSTVIGPEFVRNMPLNGRSLQDLISVTPGVVTASPQTSNQTPGGNGDFSVNGQRTESNYYMVDGVSANVGATYSEPAGQSGVVAASTALGTTQNLLSVDALQEFRVTSSTYSAEYGRSPGGQFSFLTRSGTNAFHGSVFDYLRNGYFDANNWFNDQLGQAKLDLHQNDFGGTFGGPVWIPNLYKGTNRTFFFASYEGLRLSQPTAAAVQYVPDMYMRQQAPLALQPILNAFPVQTAGGIDYGTPQSPNLAQFFSGYALPAVINATSIRVDQTLTPKLSLFFRLGYAPSSVETRSLSSLTTQHSNTQSYTVGVTDTLSDHLSDEFRINYSRNDASTEGAIDAFAGANPIDLGTALGLESPVNSEDTFQLYFPVGSSTLGYAPGSVRGRQWNITDTVSYGLHRHQLKFGVDYRLLKTSVIRPNTLITAVLESTASILNNSANFVELEKFLNPTELYNQTSLFAQDEWRITPRVTISTGVRWELSPPPGSGNDNKPSIVVGNLGEPASLSVAPAGTPLWKTSWFNFAPRLGIAWQAHNTPGWETVVRAGAGVFYDSSNEAATTAFADLGYSATQLYTNVPVPITSAQQSFQITVTPPYTTAVAYPEHLQMPYSLEWSAAISQSLGRAQTLTTSYVASEGRRLTQTQELSLSKLNSNFTSLYIYPGGVTSNYQGLQVSFQRQVSTGINALVSYTWSHSLDFGSNYATFPLTRGNSDFDVRNNLQAGLTWDLPFVNGDKYVSAAFSHWGLDGRLLARTGFPITLLGNLLADPSSGTEYESGVNLNAGVPVYLYSPTYPGGRSLNKAAFSLPSGTSQGDAPRNFVRGFGMNQINVAARRDFHVGDRLTVQFRAEAFNVLNHPVFGYINPTLTNALFGQATQTLSQSLGTVASQYQQGGARSMQFALKLRF